MGIGQRKETVVFRVRLFECISVSWRSHLTFVSFVKIKRNKNSINYI